jgi:hypothetical protein
MKDKVVLYVSILALILYSLTPIYFNIRKNDKFLNSMFSENNVVIKVVEQVETKIEEQSTNQKTEKPVKSKTPSFVQREVSNISNCVTKFESKYLKFGFEYDNCYWNISEVATFDEFSSIKTYELNILNMDNRKFSVDFSQMGMGWGYPGCLNVKEIMQLYPSEVLRAEVEYDYSDKYMFFGKNFDYAIKGITENNGNFDSFIAGDLAQAHDYPNFCFQTVQENVVNPRDEFKSSVGFQNNWAFSLSMEIRNFETYDANYLYSGNQLAIAILNQSFGTFDDETIAGIGFTGFTQAPLNSEFVSYLSSKEISPNVVNFERSKVYPMIMDASSYEYGVKYGNTKIASEVKEAFLPEPGYKFVSQDGRETVDYSAEFYRVSLGQDNTSKYIIGAYLVPNMSVAYMDLYVRIFDLNLNEISRFKINQKDGVDNAYVINVTDNGVLYLTYLSSYVDAGRSEEYYALDLKSEDKTPKKLYGCTWTFDMTKSEQPKAVCKE